MVKKKTPASETASGTETTEEVDEIEDEDDEEDEDEEEPAAAGATDKQLDDAMAAAASAPNGAEKTPAKKEPAESKTVTKTLQVKLTDEDIAKLGKEMADAEVRIEGFKAEVAGINERKRKLEGFRNETGHAIEQGFIEREVLCDVLQVFSENVVRTVRRDTGEVVTERAMEAHERQGHMDFTKPQEVVEPDADPAPDSSLRTMADEQGDDAEGIEGDDDSAELDDEFDEDAGADDGETLNA